MSSLRRRLRAGHPWHGFHALRSFSETARLQRRREFADQSGHRRQQGSAAGSRCAQTVLWVVVGGLPFCSQSTEVEMRLTSYGRPGICSSAPHPPLTVVATPALSILVLGPIGPSEHLGPEPETGAPKGVPPTWALRFAIECCVILAQAFASRSPLAWVSCAALLFRDRAAPTSPRVRRPVWPPPAAGICGRLAVRPDCTPNPKTCLAVCLAGGASRPGGGSKTLRLKGTLTETREATLGKPTETGTLGPFIFRFGNTRLLILL